MSESVKIYRDNKENTNAPIVDTLDVVTTPQQLTQAQREIDEKVKSMDKEYGGRSKDKGLEPTRYGDWELKGRCVDF